MSVPQVAGRGAATPAWAGVAAARSAAVPDPDTGDWAPGRGADLGAAPGRPAGHHQVGLPPARLYPAGL